MFAAYKCRGYVGEAHATRELEQLRRVADQVSVQIRWRRAVRKASAEPDPDNRAPWFEHMGSRKRPMRCFPAWASAPTG